MIIAGEREDGQRTLEFDYDMRAAEDVLAIKLWKSTEDGAVLESVITTLPVADDALLREKLVASLAAALGVPYTTTDRRKALEEDFRRERRGEPMIYGDPQWRSSAVSGL